MEAALFVPSGTMANQCAIHVHCRPGDEVICEERSHVTLYEAGGIARWSGASVKPLRAEDGFPDPADIEAAVKGQDVHLTRSRLLVIENTHNMAGGRVLDPDGFAARVAAARVHGLLVHIDGARIANAAVALGCDVAALTAGADSVSMCLSKALGAPIGSVVAGGADFVAEVRRVRKAFGGGMRQVGVIAAAARLALRDGPAALVRDHERAQRLATALDGLPQMSVARPETNIVMLDLSSPSADDLVRHLARKSVLAMAVRPDRIRFVTHRDLDEAAVDTCIATVTDWSRSNDS